MFEKTLDRDDDDERDVLFNRLHDSGYFRILVDGLVPHGRRLTGDALGFAGPGPTGLGLSTAPSCLPLQAILDFRGSGGIGINRFLKFKFTFKLTQLGQLYLVSV